jgi:hypothetical protein
MGIRSTAKKRSATVQPIRSEAAARQRQDAHAFLRPPRHGQDAARPEMLQVLDEGLHRVEVVLGERERARGGRRPRVDERSLDDVVAFARSGDEVPAVVDVHLNVGPLVSRPDRPRKRPRITSLTMIELISTPTTRRAPKTSADQTSRPPPGADDQRLAVRRHDPVRERRHFVAQKRRVLRFLHHEDFRRGRRVDVHEIREGVRAVVLGRQPPVVVRFGVDRNA